MKLTGCLLTFLVAFIITIIVAVGNVLRTLFKIKRKFESSQEEFSTNQNKAQNQQNSNYKKNSSASSNTNKDKVFGDNEGEYVDYEEIK